MVKKKKDSAPKRKSVANNRRAFYDFFIEEKIEAGIVLLGPEVKSLRSGKANIQDSYAGVSKGDLYLFNAYIPEYNKASQFSHETRRPRKLLLHKNEIKRLAGLVQRKGYTLVALDLYFNPRGIAKVELGLALGKNKHDKRETEKKRDWDREKSKLLRAKN